MKAFYYYMQYLDQALFPQLALLAVGSVSVIHKEFCQWLKYVHLLYNSVAGKLLVKPEMKEQFDAHNLPKELPDLTKTEVKTLNAGENHHASKTIKQSTVPNQSQQKPSQNQQKSSQNKQKRPHRQAVKISASDSKKDEIDDIFDLF